MILLTLAIALLQEPAPAPEQEPEQDPAGGVTLEEISAAMDEVSKGMAKVSENLGTATADPEQLPSAEALDPALASAEQLVADMEALLALIPKPPPPPPESGGGGQQQNPDPQSGNQMAGDLPTQDGEDPQSSDGDGEEEGTEGGQRPPDAPMSDLLRAPRVGEWGNLPPRLQQSIDAASSGEVPLRYRRWLIEYHRRVGERQ